MDIQAQHTSPQRLFRAAVLNGVEPCPCVRAQLEAVGINTSELEQRILQSLGWKH